MLKKQYRLCNNNDFKNVYKNGKRHYDSGVLLYYAPNGLTHHRIACVVGKKYSLSAVRRNAQKRILSNVYTKLFPIILNHYDMIFIYTNRDNMLPYKEAFQILQRILRKASLIK